MPSDFLSAYLRARARGATVEEASAVSGIGIVEARLHEKDIESGAIRLADYQEGEKVMPKADELTDVPETDDPLVELAADTLRGDIRDSLLGWFKAQPKSWPFMAEREQRDLADAADRFSGSLIKQACQIIAAGERPCIVANLVEYKEKEGVEAKLKLPSKGEVVQALHEACGREVLIVCSGAEEFQGESAPAEITADQPKMPGIGDEYDEAA